MTKPSFASVVGTAVVVAIAAGAVQWRLKYLANSPLDEKYEHWYKATGTWREEDKQELLELVKNPEVNYQTALQDQTSKAAHIGEAVPKGADGTCPHPFLVPLAGNNTHCALPQRFDIGRHQVLTGGPGGRKETFEHSVRHLTNFLAYLMDKDGDSFENQLKQFQALDRMFSQPDYLQKATEICEGHGVFDPFQLNLIINLPGIELPMHLDVPWFWGANRYTVPQWLLVAMERSGLFEDKKIPQIQGVAWLHEDGSVNNTKTGGQFFFYPNGPAKPAVTVPSIMDAMVVVDGCRVVHGVRRFTPEAELPDLKKDLPQQWRYIGDDTWGLYANGASTDGPPTHTYKTNQLRIALAWRARCFQSEEKRAEYQGHLPDHVRKGGVAQSDDLLSLDTVLNRLRADMEARGVMTDLARRDDPAGRLALGTLILDTYVHYPIDNHLNTMVALNYCALPRLLVGSLAPARPLAEAALSPFCAD